MCARAMTATMRRLAIVAAGLAALALLAHTGGAGQGPPYRDPGMPVGLRVADLLSRMTLEEKVAQLVAIWQQKPAIQDDQGNFDPARAAAVLASGLGQVARPSEIKGGPTGPATREPRAHAVFTNAVQRWVIENTRLGVPVMFHEEALHGLANPKGTHFPVPLALASTWDPALVERLMAVAALEARARGCQQVLSPVLDLARDPRWGRTEETYGEDPYLVSRLGVAAIRGYQGRSLPLGKDKVFATAKHFAFHGPHEGGINAAPVNFPERAVRSELLAPFEAAITEAGAYTVMPSYNELDGVPSHKSRWLLEEVLRREWGFRGLVVSDYFAVKELHTRHAVAADLADAARQALAAGVDLELPDREAFGSLVEQVRDGRVSQATVDRAVARVLRAKLLAGLFEEPYADPDRAEQVANAPQHQALALEAARKAIVLLKNEGGLLPLDRVRLRSIAVIGPNAKGVHLGGYSSDPGRGVSVLEGIRQEAGPGTIVLYAEGVRITEHEPNWSQDEVVFGDPVRNRRRIQEAVGVARRADVAVLVIGNNESTSREAYSDEHLGDVVDLSLTSQQDELVEAVRAAGKPVVVVLLNGRPLAIPRVAETVPAILEGFYLGQEGGTAVAEALFGDVNPGGKLPISVPRHVGQLPVYYNRKPTSFRPHLDMTREPLWPFGHGLSYTTFELGSVAVSPERIGPAGRATVTVE
ncbi:MAG TPA: glycoside hydrolase family 3 N-terminal domain-containing protein, partial [Vicinamibacteria bacterium]|nr:glycoside hydrolase family 3 N-terminal domain-containing protein [Vicinamibacteria bacterium]